MSGNALEALREDEAAWEARTSAFHDYQALWQDRGFVQMFRRLMRREEAAARLLAFEDGERRLTNLLHLTELLQFAAGAEASGDGGADPLAGGAAPGSGRGGRGGSAPSGERRGIW